MKDNVYVCLEGLPAQAPKKLLPPMYACSYYFDLIFDV
jgi:hypothetical protein